MPKITEAADLQLATDAVALVGVALGNEKRSEAARMEFDPSQVRTTREDRNAILASLYEERSKFTRAKRLGEISANDDEYLEELNQYIDHWEATETRTVRNDDVWSKLNDLASSVLALQTKIEPRQK